LQAPVTVLAGLRAIVDSRQGVVTHGVSPGSSVARRWVENGWEGADGRAQVAGMTRWRSQASYCIPKRLVKQPVMQQTSYPPTFVPTVPAPFPAAARTSARGPAGW